MRPTASNVSAAFLAIAVLAPTAAWSQSASFPPPASIVRSTATPTVDGDLADWTGITAEHPIIDLSGRPVASFKLQADDTTLYVAFAVRDDSPMRNASATLEELIKGGDAVGLCLGPVQGKGLPQRLVAAEVGGRAVLMAMRPTWPVKRPHSFASPVSTLRMDFVGPVDGAQVAVRRRADGYDVELALPWAALGLPPRFDGEIPFDAQVIFSDPAGTVNADTAWWHAAGGPGYTTEDLPTEAALQSDSWGRARRVARDPGPQPARRAAVASLGDPLGEPITFTLPRAARVSLLVCAPDGWIVRELLRAERLPAGEHTVRWNGRDRYDETLPPGPYTWRLAYFDGMGTEFHGSVGNSARPPFRTADGKGSMGGQHGGPSVVAADAGGIYIAGGTEEGHPALRKIDRDGHTLWKRSMGGFGSGAAVVAEQGMAYLVQRNRDGLFLVRLNSETGSEQPVDEKTLRVKIGERQQRVGGLAVVGGRAYVSFPEANRIAVYSLPDGAVEADVTVPEPQGLAQHPTDRLLICSGAAVLAYDPARRAITRVVEGLDSPSAVAVDAQGRLYVSELGARQQVRLFDKGRAVATLGVAGGRAETVLSYDPLALQSVSGLAVDAEGAVWLVERSPLRRVARFSPAGACELDLFGPVAYNVFGPDLDDLSVVYYQTSQGSPVYARTRLDYTTYRADPVRGGTDAWGIEAVFQMTQAADEAAGEQDLLGPAMKPGYGHVVAFTGSNGQRYLWRFAKSNRATTPSGAAIWRWTDTGWVPAAFVSNSSKDDAMSWSDTNGDSRAQVDECYDPPPTRNFAWLDRDLTLYGWDGSLRPARIDGRGVPYYDGGAYAPYLREGEAALPGGWVFNSMPAADGAVYYAANLGPHRHLSSWDRAAENQILKVQDGRIRWVIGQHDPHARFDGSMSTVSGIAGIVDDILIAHIVEPAQYIAFTTDGFTLGNIVVDADGKRPSVGSNAIYIESFTGLFLKDNQSGKRLLFAVSSGDDRILEVTGPGRLTRLEGTLTLASSAPREAVPAGQATIPYETWWGNSARGYGINAEGWQWTERSAGLTIRDRGVAIGDVRLRRDAGALHVLANVLESGGMKAEPTVPDGGEAGRGTLLGVELSLGPAGTEGVRGPVPGDTRVFLAVDGKKPVALAWRVDRDGWQPIPNAKVAVKSRWHGYGWRVEAELPLELLPELTRAVPQRFRRGVGGKPELQWIEEERLDLVAPLRLNAAFHLRGQDGVRRVAWVEDGTDLRQPGAMQPARWGYANASVELSWGAAPGVAAYALYRAPVATPLAVERIADAVTGTSHVDAPGLGEFLYWLAPVTSAGIGQPVGPVTAHESRATFPPVGDVAPPVPLEAVRELLVGWPRRTGFLRVATDAARLEATAAKGAQAVATRDGGGWLVAVLLPPVARPGDVYPVTLQASGGPASPSATGALDVLVGLNLMAGLVPGALPVPDPLAGGWMREPAADADTGSVKHIARVVAGDGGRAPCLDMQAWNSDNTLRHPLGTRPVERYWRVDGELRILARAGGTTIGVTVYDAQGVAIGTLRFTPKGAEAQGQFLADPAHPALGGEWQPFRIAAEAGVVRLTLGQGADARTVEADALKGSDWRQPASVALHLGGRSSGRHARFGNLTAVFR